VGPALLWQHGHRHAAAASLANLLPPPLPRAPLPRRRPSFLSTGDCPPFPHFPAAVSRGRGAHGAGGAPPQTLGRQRALDPAQREPGRRRGDTSEPRGRRCVRASTDLTSRGGGGEADGGGTCGVDGAPLGATFKKRPLPHAASSVPPPSASRSASSASRAAACRARCGVRPRPTPTTTGGPGWGTWRPSPEVPSAAGEAGDVRTSTSADVVGGRFPLCAVRSTSRNRGRGRPRREQAASRAFA